MNEKLEKLIRGLETELTNERSGLREVETELVRLEQKRACLLSGVSFLIDIVKDVKDLVGEPVALPMSPPALPTMPGQLIVGKAYCIKETGQRVGAFRRVSDMNDLIFEGGTFGADISDFVLVD